MEYSNEIQKEIESKIVEIGAEKYLGKDPLENIVITSDDNCQRCNSQNFEKISETEFRSGGLTGYEVELVSYKCKVCGFNAEKDVPKTIGERIKDFFLNLVNISTE
jgi:DNA-directed RNA polymerase subunit RPC12/RpoP